MIKVFVYGTLKRGYGNHRLLIGRSIFVGADSIRGKLYDLGNFPGVWHGNDLVQGEVYKIAGPEVLRDLDCLEGHPRFYKRTRVTTSAGLRVFVYMLPTAERYSYLAEGVWPKAA
jgi:gamma-glutamylcyclotransferase (GGCT)/AIG2-like uncharacterized protein YtfP